MSVSIDGSGSITGIDQGFNVTGGIQVGTGATINGSTNTITALTNGSERIRVTSNGNVGIGTNTVGNIVGRSQVVIGGDSGGLLDFNVGGTTEARMFATDATGLTIRASESDGGIIFQTGGSNQRLIITAAGNVGVTDGDLSFADGHGISFAATTDGSGMSSELLDDYEEGSFTPVLSFAGGTTGVTYSMQEGHYTKIGRQVIAQFRIQLTSEGSSTGTLRITLPFTALDTFSSTGIDGNIFVAYSSGFTQAQIGDNPVSGYVGGGTNYVIFNARRSTGDAVTLNQTDIDDDFSVSCTAFYYAT